MKIESPLCHCNNCETILIDENPQVNAKIYTIIDNYCESFPNKKIEMMAYMKDKNSQDQQHFWYCPICETDDYLIDL